MKRIIYPSGYEIVTDDLSGMQEFLADQIKERTSEIFNVGISGTYKAYVTTGTNANTIKILALNAYDAVGERISIPIDVNNLAPDNTDKTTLVTNNCSWTNNIRYIVVARYAELDSTPLIHPITGVQEYSRKDASYTLHALRRSGGTIDSFGANDVKLARIDVNGSGVPSITVNQLDITEGFALTDYCHLEADRVNTEIGSTNMFYDIGMQLTLQDHINSRGTGEIISASNPHGLGLADMMGSIDGSRITDNSISNVKLTANTITAAKIAPGTITATQLAADSVQTTQILNGAVTESKLSGAIATKDVMRFVVQGTLEATVNLPVVRVLNNKTGVIRSVMVYTDTLVEGSSSDLIIDVRINGVTNSIFSYLPRIVRGRAANTTEGGILSKITPSAPTGFDVGQINESSAIVAEGDRIGLHITSVGDISPGGDDLIVVVVTEPV